MTSLTSTTSQPGVRELNASEIDATAGGVDPLTIAVAGTLFFLGVALGGVIALSAR
ncbi:MAG: hypothetical protein AB7O57_08160 [Hyphomicrobiaceae bacterium]